MALGLSNEARKSYTVNDKILEGLKFGEFGELCCICQIYLPNPCKLAILDEFAKLSSAKQIYWQIHQTLVSPIFIAYSTL